MHLSHTATVVHISNFSLIAQTLLIARAVLTAYALPQEEVSNGTLCPVDDRPGMSVLVGIAFASLAVGAIALTSAFTIVRRLLASVLFAGDLSAVDHEARLLLLTGVATGVGSVLVMPRSAELGA